MSKAGDIANKAYERGLSAGKGFIGARLGAVWNGTKDVLGTTLGSIEDEKGLLGIGSIIRNTAKEIWDTVSWNSDRGLLNFKETSILPFGSKTFILNPFEPLRRMGAGLVETVGTPLGTGVEVIKNTIGGISKGIARAAMGIVTGDFGQYYSSGKAPHTAPAAA